MVSFQLDLVLRAEAQSDVRIECFQEPRDVLRLRRFERSADGGHGRRCGTGGASAAPCAHDGFGTINLHPLRPDDFAVVPVAGGVLQDVAAAFFELVQGCCFVVVFEASLRCEIFFVANRF